MEPAQKRLFFVAPSDLIQGLVHDFVTLIAPYATHDARSTSPSKVPVQSPRPKFPSNYPVNYPVNYFVNTRRLAARTMLGCALPATLASIAFASDGTSVPSRVRAWQNAPGYWPTIIQQVESLGQASQIAAHSLDGVITGPWGYAISIRPDGTLGCVGNFPCGPCANLPTNPLPFVTIAAGPRAAGAIDSSGAVSTFGVSSASCFQPQHLPPTDLGACLKLSAGNNHFLALRTDGAVRAWGVPDTSGYNVHLVPPDAATATDIAAFGSTNLVLRPNGTIFGWGLSTPLTGAPANLTQVTDIALGGSHTIVLRADGSVVCWGGTNSSGQTTVPANLLEVPVVSVHAGEKISAALRADGSLVTWGFPGNMPALPPVRSVALGTFFSSVIVEADCNENGVDDTTELAGNDCNANGVHDACDIYFDRLEDCDGNGIGDSCSAEEAVALSSPVLSPFGYGTLSTWTIPAAKRALYPVTLRVKAFGDLGGGAELCLVRVGSTLVETYTQAPDCTVVDWRTITVPASVFNAAIDANGAVAISATGTIAVDPNGCFYGTRVQFDLAYITNTPADCNANGLLDVCEIAGGYAVDANKNGIIDLCETSDAGCVGDIDRDGEVGSADLSLLLAAWSNPKTAAEADLTGDGIIDGMDLGTLLEAWGACAP